MFKRSTLTAMTALVAGTMAFGMPGSAHAKEPVATDNTGKTVASQPVSEHARNLINKLHEAKAQRDQASDALSATSENIRRLNEKIEAWQAEAANPANKGLVNALKIAINGARADVEDYVQIAREQLNSYLDADRDVLGAQIGLLRAGIRYDPNWWRRPAINLDPNRDSLQRPNKPRHTVNDIPVETGEPVEFDDGLMPATGFYPGHRFSLGHDPHWRLRHDRHDYSKIEKKHKEAEKAEPAEHLPSASSTDPHTGETTTSKSNGDGTRTVTKTDKNGKVVSKKKSGRKLSKKQRRLKKAKLNKKRMSRKQQRKLRKARLNKKRFNKRMNKRMRMKRRGFRKMRRKGGGRMRRNRG